MINLERCIEKRLHRERHQRLLAHHAKTLADVGRPPTHAEIMANVGPEPAREAECGRAIAPHEHAFKSLKSATHNAATGTLSICPACKAKVSP